MRFLIDPPAKAAGQGEKADEPRPANQPSVAASTKFYKLHELIIWRRVNTAIFGRPPRDFIKLPFASDIFLESSVFQ
ncbi:hypothetical protein RhiLY_12399 [Ceratobasidium sp. AG-Ba]|nr:hypothetical protein RhiLY_12399 [Ceratobasidium sp. AG-Ba]